MEKEIKKLNAARLAEFAGRIYEPFRAAPSRGDAITLLAAAAAADLGSRLNIGILSDPDDVAMGFVELLDQIIFEISEEKTVSNGNSNEYLIDDLYGRAEVYLELYSGIETYKRSFPGRIMCHDDAVIIRQYRLQEFIPNLIAGFFEQPHLRRPIAHALMFFDHEELLNFFYEIAKNDYDLELRVCAVAGLKSSRLRFYNWKSLLSQDDGQFNSLIEYASSENGEPRPAAGPSRENFLILYYRLLRLERAMNDSFGREDCRTLLDILHSISSYSIEDLPIKISFYESLSRLLSKVQCRAMREFLEEEANLASFIHLVDALPAEMLDRVVLMIESMGESFVASIKRLIAMGRLHLDEKNSRLFAHLYSLGFDPLLL